MRVALIRYTPEAADLVGEAAAICTKSDDIDRSRRGAMASGHTSVAEHASFSFLIEGVSRSLLAQLTRHRIASFSVESQRYVQMENMEYVTPATIAANDSARAAYDRLMERIEEMYHLLIEHGVPAEDARYVLPNATCTRLVVTMNARELLHFFSLRCCNRAQWEIREMADQMLMLCRNAAPQLFSKAGPGCVTGRCPEGKMSCGRPRV